MRTCGFNGAGASDGKHYLLTAAVPASGWLLRGQETYGVTRYLDHLNIMSYDLHSAWNHFVGPNAALYDGQGYLNTDWTCHYFRSAMHADRINIGAGFYARGWRGVTGGTKGMWGPCRLRPLRHRRPLARRARRHDGDAVVVEQHQGRLPVH
ncbi:glycosyl hydrolase family 18 protein [Lentzea sp. HUAS TT2]|uniref:glycosyl hydrolase family 18 protein n=1 Tax=Lentzea sp. HUAS TT2 TaxID=3447454 RepID=UPI003F6E559D